jgi:hypothetical protein
MNKQRLLDAADWAEKNIDPKMFDMGHFREGQHTKPECDSTGCMVGHLTAIDAENFVENYLNSYGNINFLNWSRDYFEVKGYEWSYLFHESWAEVDNTLEGAIARMRRLANGMTDQEILEELKKIEL